MTTVYINEFTNVTQTVSTSATCFGDDTCGGVPLSDMILVGAANPNSDPGLPVLFPNSGVTEKLKLGPMKAGSSLPAPGSSSPAIGSICQVIAGVVNVGEPRRLQPAGLQATVCLNENADGVAQSQTLYLVPGDAHADLAGVFEIRSPFVGPGTLTAELIFDSPEICGGVGDIWAVALNFKKNGQNDGGTVDDAPFGPTCQFSGVSGDVDPVTLKLNQIEAPESLTSTYAALKNTTFTLTASLSVDHTGIVTGSASLKFGHTVFSGDVKMPATGFDLSLVNAVGVAIVSPKNTYKWVRVMLRRFTLYAAPPPPFLHGPKG
jgi:hypothetical protein